MNKIVMCGVQSQGIEIMEFLIEHGIAISHIVTITQEKAEAVKAAGWVDYSAFATKYDIPIYYCEKYTMKSETDINFFKFNQFDILLLGGWQRLISKEILDTLKFYGIGQHGSVEFLPHGKGRSPINWNILQGKKRLVWNIFKIDEGVDRGDIIDYKIIQINDWDDVNSIYQKVSIIIKYMYLENIPKILNCSVKLKPQIGDSTYYEKRTEDDGLINWESSIYDIYNHVRSVTKPYPGAFTYYKNQKIKIWKVVPFDQFIDYYKDVKNGTIVESFDNELIVKCNDGLLKIVEYDYNNIKKENNIYDWLGINS